MPHWLPLQNNSDFFESFFKLCFRYIKQLFETLFYRSLAIGLKIQKITLDFVQDDFKFTETAPELPRTIILPPGEDIYIFISPARNSLRLRFRFFWGP
jgi:hypothetical protein